MRLLKQVLNCRELPGAHAVDSSQRFQVRSSIRVSVLRSRRIQREADVLQLVRTQLDQVIDVLDALH